MPRSRRVLAIGGKQRILRLDMVCIETIFFSFRFALRDKNNIKVDSIQNDDNSENNTSF